MPRARERRRSRDMSESKLDPVTELRAALEKYRNAWCAFRDAPGGDDYSPEEVAALERLNDADDFAFSALSLTEPEPSAPAMRAALEEIAREANGPESWAAALTRIEAIARAALALAAPEGRKP